MFAALTLGATIAGSAIVGTTSAQLPPSDADPRQPVYSGPSCGKVSFPVRCTLDENQKYFDRGIALLHGGAPLEAERSFRQIVSTEPDVAMAYWGMAMANVDAPSRAAGFIEQALLYWDKATPRERQWIELLAKYYETSRDRAEANRATLQPAGDTVPEPRLRGFSRSTKERSRGLLAGYAQLVASAPEDVEAVAFRAAQVLRNRDLGLDVPAPATVEDWVQKVLAANPEHPIHRQRIRLWTGVDPGRALDSASKIGSYAPAVPAHWHAAGRLFAALNRHEDAAWQYEAAVRVGHANMARYRMMPFRVPGHVELQQSFVRSLANTGQVRRALAHASELIALPRHPRFNAAGDPKGLAGSAPELLAEICRDFQMLEELKSLEDRGSLSTGKNRFGRVRVAAELASAYLELGELERGKARMIEVRGMRADAWDRATALKIERWMAEHRALLAVAEGRRNEALAALTASWNAAVPIEHRADAFLALGEFTRARSALEKALAKTPGRVHLLARQVFALSKAKADAEALRAAFEELRTAAGHGDANVPLLARLGPIAKRLGLPADWRLPRQPSEDHAPRRALDELGPIRWQPIASRDWKLLGLNGKPVEFAQYKDRPVVIILYLGFGCIHCVEQLREFHPFASKFKRADLPILAIGTDSAKNMSQAMADLPLDERFSYTMLSDRKMRVFREWVAYDFFGQAPMHGTFLVDQKGEILFQDISHEPFNHPEWLLKECRRLLGK